MIIAPVDGVVGNRTLRVGQYVQAGTQLMAVVPLAEAYIVANFKETQLTDVKPGQTVEIEVDMFPGIEVEGPCRQHRAGQRPGIRPAAARQRDRQLHQGRAARPGEDRARPGRQRSPATLRPGMSVVADHQHQAVARHGRGGRALSRAPRPERSWSCRAHRRPRIPAARRRPWTRPACRPGSRSPRAGRRLHGDPQYPDHQCLAARHRGRHRHRRRQRRLDLDLLSHRRDHRHPADRAI